jgi:phosphoglycerol transferase
LALCLLIGALGTDYAIFTIALIVVCSLIGVAWVRRPRRLVSPLILCTAIAATLAVQYLPTVIYHARNGPNPVVGKRNPFESELYGLKVAALVLPQPQDRIAPLATIGKAYAAQERDLGPANEDSFDTLGLIGALGFLGLLALGLGAIVRRGPPSGPRSLANRAALATIVAVLAGIAGGFPILFAIFVTPEVRAWNRIAVFIGFFALLAVALVLDRVRSWLARDRRRLAAWGILGAILLFGIYDQTNNGPAFVPAYAQYAASARSTGALVASIERQLPRGASVWQLPYTGFPETPPHAAELPYDQLVPYLYSHGLKWSGGALLGRPTDWQARLTKVPLPGVAAGGFDGILVDRRAYKDAGAAVVRELTHALGPPALASRDRRYTFFDLRPYARTLRARFGPAFVAALARATVGRAPRS